ncbi:EAL domain-containing protein [Aquitalea sp.]|uniref:bifunctional diguanylate cyclase/phosphodiesterase n=1 Tax=Aquitalea sp. TaxID=1872623 RepID=UPI00258CCC32|nr:EAL domain-containing protein [Aquitalea sp.]
MSVRLPVIMRLAVAYALIGIPSLYSAIPPGYTAPVFPAAGIALMSLLLWGRRLWPGVLLGSLLVQLVASWQSGVQGTGFLALLVVPSAATLQALTGRWLVTRWIGWPNRLDSPYSVIRLMLLLIPLSCLVSSGLSVPLLVALGVLTQSDTLFNVWNWWLGDTFGCLIMLPLMLAWFGRPRSEWRARSRALLWPMLMTALTMGSLSVLIHHWEALRVQSQFNRDANQIEQALRKRLDMQLDVMLALQQLQSRSPATSADQWRELTGSWLARLPGTQSLGWSPLVSDADRAGFEREVLGGSPVKARDGDGHTQPSPQHPSYLPIRFNEPVQPNQRALGLDILSSPVLAGTIRRSMQSGQSEASPAIRLVQEVGQQKAIALYQAVYGPSDTQQHQVLRGVISSLFRMDDIVNVTLQHGVRHDIEVCLIDRDGLPGFHRLSGPQNCGKSGWFGQRPHIESLFAFAGRNWALRLRASDDYLDGLRSWLEWVAFVIGLALTGLFGGFLLIVTGYTRRMEGEVQQRTAELADANQQLQTQLDATRKAEANVTYLALHDSLTGLPNRPCWLNMARNAMAGATGQQQQLAVLFLDMDEFKTVNDSLGHPVGDQLLVSIARRLQQPLPPDATLARLGGDEFVILLPYTQQHQLDSLGEQLQALFDQGVLVEAHELRCTVSIGVALFPQDGQDPDTLLRHADMAMYAAKEAGRDTLRYYSPEMNVLAMERLTLERDLRRALQDDPAQLVLHYQPQVDAASGTCVGCEALVRWQHPQRGLMLPGEFIPLAERSGLIVELGRWVLAEACAEQARWSDAGMQLPVSVNLSPIQLERSDLQPYVKGLLQRHGLMKGALELELTEGALMKEDDHHLQAFNGLVALGCRFALDDFGTGYSSLSRLRRFPISRLKIDRGFVRTLPGNTDDEAVVRATLSMARDMGMDVVAEGVETQAQSDCLQQMGCRIMQGYWFARPMPADQLRAFVSGVRQPVDPD